MRLFKFLQSTFFISLFVFLVFSQSLTCHENSSIKRSDLKVPDELWNYILSNVGHEGKTLGYTFEEMDYFDFYDHEFRLKVVWDLFRDVPGIADFGGEVGDYFLANYNNPSSVVDYCYDMIVMEDETISSKRTTNEYLPQALSEDDFTFDSQIDKTDWDSLPQKIKDFVITVVEFTNNSSTILQQVYNKTFLAQNLGVSVDNLDNVNRQQLYEFIAQPWRSASPTAPSFDSMYEVDIDNLSSATSVFITGVTSALNDVKAWLAQNPLGDTDFDTIKFDSPAGRVFISGTGDQKIYEENSIIIDLGGDDSYSGSQAVPRSFTHAVGTIIDLSGNDTYENESGIAEFCTGLFGIGAIFDSMGNDVYICGESGLASAWQGTGLLIDYAGNDIYDSKSSWCQGAAHAGVGLLIDLSGYDEYLSIQQSQGFGSSLGIGAILDVSGNDRYNAEGEYSAPFYNNTAFCQGAGFGRRADYGGGRSLAGGIGILVDGDGDDSYWGPVYVQGCGYWWAAGIFEDRGGNDNYRCWQYSLGSAPHMAIGCMVDLKGDDKYNAYYGDSSTQYHSCARDGSIGVFIDGEGNDLYYNRNRSAGEGELNSIAFFWDRMGDDVYDSNLDGRFIGDPPYGFAAKYGNNGNMRDEIMTVSIFLDSDGHDVYTIDPKDYGVSLPASNDNSEWYYAAETVFWGIGLDIDWYSTHEVE
ncbi:hypothetical protein KKB18_00290 [bacterium]|nr:hypothetical protein [bacterium]